MSQAKPSGGDSPVNAELLAAAIDGLSGPEKFMSPKWLYDRTGSELFDQICELPEYYPTRVETSILEANAGELASAIGPDAVLFEPGAGSLTKARILLAAMERPAAFVPTDISAEHLRRAADELAAEFPELMVQPIGLDFTRSLHLPEPLKALGPVAVFFPGSTIGNLEPLAAEALLRRFRTESAAKRLVIGVDLVKELETLLAAYDDASRVTAAFNKNLLVRMNREIGSDFDIDAFRHVALFNSSKSRIEMHLESLKQQTVTIDDAAFRFREGERIHTESSHKYTPERFISLAERAGWTQPRLWTDDSDGFGVFSFEAKSGSA